MTEANLVQGGMANDAERIEALRQFTRSATAQGVVLDRAETRAPDGEAISPEDPMTVERAALALVADTNGEPTSALSRAGVNPQMLGQMGDKLGAAVMKATYERMVVPAMPSVIAGLIPAAQAGSHKHTQTLIDLFKQDPLAAMDERTAALKNAPDDMALRELDLTIAALERARDRIRSRMAGGVAAKAIVEQARSQVATVTKAAR
jgi:hypothetical protein